MLINIWFSPLVAGYFSVVSRFCLSPVMIVGNAVRNSIFSKWSMDFRNGTFNYPEYKKIRLLLMSRGADLYPWDLDFLSAGHAPGLQSGVAQFHSDLTLYAALSVRRAGTVSPLTVIELIFGSKRYFLRIQIEQLLIIIVAFIALPELGQRYEIALLTFSVLTSIRYLFILLKMNKRALQLSRQEQKICS